MKEQSRFCLYPPSTDFDYCNMADGIDRPIVAHEVGQWSVYLYVGITEKFTVVLKPGNLEIIKQSLIEGGLEGQAKDFARASGRLAFILYKEEIEAYLRTYPFGGFQLLDIRDFPGQGTSMVGMLDPFWDSKGITGPVEFSEYCSETVPLLRMEKLIWTEEETFTGKLEIAHYGKYTIGPVKVECLFMNEQGKIIFQMEMAGQYTRNKYTEQVEYLGVSCRCS